jgi:ABC-type multidrug transport system ATPase subunit
LKLETAPAPSSDRSISTSVAIEVRDAAYRYGERPALDGLSLSVPQGAIFGLLGPNGSGKSTLLSLLVGLRQPAAGEIRVLGAPPSPSVRAKVGIVFQERSLDPQMTVRETMALQGRLFGMTRDDIAARTGELLERMGLLDRAGSFTRTLSGGMKRRLELARALLPDPEVIVLDEPTLALDPDSKHRLWEHLMEANAEGRTLLLATNDVAEAERYCDTVALIDSGRLVAQGAPAELKAGLRREAVRVEWRSELAARSAQLDGWAEAGHVRLAGQTTHVTVDAASPFLTRLFQQCGDQIHGVRIEQSTLEDVYFQLVGKGIHPGAAGDGE